MEKETLDIFGESKEDFFESLQNAIDEVKELGATDLNMKASYSEIGGCYVGHLTYELL